MEKPVYHRVLLKISGEALAGDKHSGLDFEVIGQVCDVIKKCLDMGVQVGLVVGGGNFWRGAKNSGGGKMERTRADHIGMLATVMNCLAVADVCEQKGIPVRVQTALEMRAIAEPYIRSRAIRHLEKGRVVIFGAGTGNPYFSTDTAAVLRAAEIDADVILLAKNVDGVYSADPVKDPTAVKYDSISYDDVLAQHLMVMDTTATSLSMDNHIPVRRKSRHHCERIRIERKEPNYVEGRLQDLRRENAEEHRLRRCGFRIRPGRPGQCRRAGPHYRGLLRHPDAHPADRCHFHPGSSNPANLPVGQLCTEIH